MKFITATTANDKPQDKTNFHLSRTFVDPQRYLSALPSFLAQLPPGAQDFASAPWHYNFSGEWSVKDLKLGQLTFLESNAFLTEWYYHAEYPPRLLLDYSEVESINRVRYWTDDDPMWVQPTILVDEILPTDDFGVTHEILFRSGESIIIKCRDLNAQWNSP